MTCSLKKTLLNSHSKGNKRAFNPSEINNKLQAIAKHMRRGRQEDSHEFLRYAIDGLQKSCLAGLPPKMNAKLAETTWVHQIFAGRLRSRVTCERCGYNSDTFDRALDLSLDISKANSLRDALRSFVAVDHLRGADKYKCEKCKQAVSARKQFTLHEAPLVLTIHLKRFSPLGRKIGNPIQYDEKITLKPIMSEGQHGPSYSLYGVICHAGGGPNSGHYFAFIKSRTGRWYEMNDDLVTLERSPPLNRKTAYILFYIQNQALPVHSSPVQQPDSPTDTSVSITKQNIIANMKKRKQMEGAHDGEQSPKKAKFIGPTLPPGLLEAQRKLSLSDPQADKLKQKIAHFNSQSNGSLVDYASDDDAASNDDVGVPICRPILNGDDSMTTSLFSADNKHKGMSQLPNPSSPSSPPPTSSPFKLSSPPSHQHRKRKSSFYKPLPRPKKIELGSADSSPPQDIPKSLSFSSFHPQNGSTPKKMHKHRHRDRDDSASPKKARSSYSHGHHNPYSSHLTPAKSLGHSKTYGKKRLRALQPA
jgi:ubiquitin carboxyl-terminal hydrolase 36/42